MSKEKNELVKTTFLDILDRELTSKALVRSLLNGGLEVDPTYKNLKFNLLSLYLSNYIHTLFLSDTIIKLSETIHKNALLRDFISEVINKMFILLGKETIEIFCQEVCLNLESLHKGEDSTYVGPRQYVFSLFFEPGALSSNTLITNPWMLFVVLLLLMFDKSQHFSIGNE